MVYHVRLEQFEGPLELLLSLIEKEKLPITEVSLARVADQFLEYVEREENVSLEHLAAFLSVASRLILLKSRALLPLLTFSDEEETAIEDLEYQLKEYQRFRKAALFFRERLTRGERAYARESFLGTQIVFHPPQDLKARDLRMAFENVLGSIPLFEKLEEETIATVMSLEEKIAQLQETLRERAESSFREMVEQAESRLEHIVAFLALLELVKQRFITVEQENFFEDIRIRRFSSS